jgi:hypothetical protein
LSAAADPVSAWLLAAAPFAERLYAGAALEPALAGLLRAAAALPTLATFAGGRSAPAASAPSPLAGLGKQDAALALEGRARAEAARFTASLAGLPDTRQAAAASLLRLLALAACGPSLLGPSSQAPAGPATPGARERLVILLCDASAAGQDFSALHADLCAGLAARNPLAAAHPQFGRFTACLAGLPRAALALRDLSKAARAHRPAPQEALAALCAAATTLSPPAWSGLHESVPAAWFSALCPARAEPGFWGSLAAECDAALEAAGLVWEAQQSPPWQLAALGALVFSRLCSVLALCEDHPFA